MRNSAGGIVQLAYGDDGLDPLRMEGSGTGQPLNLKRLLSVVRARRAAPPAAAALPAELREAADALLAERGAPPPGCASRSALGLLVRPAVDPPCRRGCRRLRMPCC